MSRGRPPYVYPDECPDGYDSDLAGEVYRVSGSTFTDGRGWNWEKVQARELRRGDIWVPIHTLRRWPILEIVARSEKLKRDPFSKEMKHDDP